MLSVSGRSVIEPLFVTGVILGRSSLNLFQKYMLMFLATTLTSALNLRFVVLYGGHFYDSTTIKLAEGFVIYSFVLLILFIIL